jgi:hypothetical protein
LVGSSTSVNRKGGVMPAASALDEEHPAEVSSRPFPIAPLLTASASADDPELVQPVHPDIPDEGQPRLCRCNT